MTHKLTLTNRRPKFMATVPAWRRTISGVRPRLLVWYFLLTAGTTLISLQTTRQIFYHNLQTRSEAAIDQQIEQFTLMIDKNRFKGRTAARTLPVLFDRLLSNYAPTGNEYIFAFIGDRLYRSSTPNGANFIQPEAIQAWKEAGQPSRGGLTIANQQVNYAVEPVSLGDQHGYIVVIHNTSAEFEMIDRSVALITQVTLLALGLCFGLAWLITTKVLAPLKLLTKTAQSITESDMSKRIAVRGRDEIAELGETFNEMLDRLQLAFDSQKDFLKDASHELKTPITVIQGHLETLKYKPEQHEDVIDLLMDELDRMGRLVNDLLILAKADHPNFLHLKAEELDWLTEELYLKVRSLAPREWRLESKGLSPITVDRQRLTQAIMNLVQNAIRHTQEGDMITLGSSVKENYAYIWVRDTGEGIAPDDQARIFERFARATRSDSVFEGHGLGLAIVSAIVDAHGGWVELESLPGHGSTFTLVMPLNPPEIYESNLDRRGQSPHQRLFGNRTSGARLRFDHREHRSRGSTNREWTGL
jgi:signal transduction histidine kinase